MFLKPKTPEMVIRDPRTRVKLPPEGRRVPDTSYWLRRRKDGDALDTTAEDIAKGKSERLAKEKASAPTLPTTDAKSDAKKGKE